MNEIAAAQKIMEIVASDSNLILVRESGFKEFRLRHTRYDKVYMLDLFIFLEDESDWKTKVYIKPEGEAGSYAVLRPEAVGEAQDRYGFRRGVKMVARDLVEVLWGNNPEVYAGGGVSLINADTKAGRGTEISNNQYDDPDSWNWTSDEQAMFQIGRFKDTYVMCVVSQTYEMKHKGEIWGVEGDWKGYVALWDERDMLMVPHTLVGADTPEECGLDLRSIGNRVLHQMMTIKAQRKADAKE